MKPGARAVVFDKFLPQGMSPSFSRRAHNLVMRFFGTDINRAFEPMAERCGCEIITDEPVALGGADRVIGVR